MKKALKRVTALMLVFGMMITVTEPEYKALAKTKYVTASAKQVTNKKTVKITWKRYSKYKKYTILRSVKKNSSYKKLAVVGISGKTGKYTDNKTKYGATYYYKIKVNNNITSKPVKVNIKKTSSETTNSTVNNNNNPVNNTTDNNNTNNINNVNNPVNNTTDNNNTNNNNSQSDNKTDKTSGDNNTGTQQPGATATPLPDIKYEESINNEEMPEAASIETMPPVKSESISDYGVENVDYYAIREDYVSSNITETAAMEDDGKSIVLNSGATLVLEGKVSDKHIVCDAKNAELTIVLNGADINVGAESFIKTGDSSCKVNIIAVNGTDNTITAAELEAGKELIDSAGGLTIAGSGELTVNNTSADSNTLKAEGAIHIADISLSVNCVKKGIVGKPVVIESGSVDIVSSSDDAVKAKGKSGFMIAGGNMTVKAKKDGINSNRYVQINGGNIRIIAEDDGIQCGGAEFNETEKVFDIDEGLVNIYEGEINIESSGTGIKANKLLNISDGNIYVKSLDKGLKAGAGYEYPEDTETPEYKTEQQGYLNIFGGTIEIHSASHSIAANGNTQNILNDNAVVIKGGKLILEAEASYTTTSQSNNGMPGGRPGFGGMESQKTGYTASGADAVQSDTGIFLENAEITIYKCNTAVQADGNLYIHNLNADITAYGKGLKAGYTDTNDKYGELTIQMGNLNIKSFDDSIHCNNNVKILEGTINAATSDDGVHADNDLYIGQEGNADEKLTINTISGVIDGKTITPYEGIEGAYIHILSGNMSLLASDDGINAAGGNDSSGSNTNNGSNDWFGRPGPGGMGGFGVGMMGETTGELYISGGNIYINAQGDSIDSNGKIDMNGGYLKIDGSDNGSDDVIDFDGAFTLNAGTVLAVGKKGVSTRSASSGSGQNNVLFTTSSNISAGAQYELVNEASEVILSGTSLKAANVFFFSDAGMTAGTYSLNINGSKKGTVTFSGNGESKSVSF